MLRGNPLNSAQKTLAGDAYRRDPASFERALDAAEQAPSPVAYFVSATRSICVAAMARSAAQPPARARRHDLSPVRCLDCGDTGFVVLTRDIGENAQAGDAAPCHCDTGQQKQSRYGTVHYAIGDFEPAVPDPTVQLMSFQEYAASAEGKRDPHLQEILRTGSSTMRSLPAELDKPISPVSTSTQT